MHRAVVKLSESQINLAQCDFILTSTIDDLARIDGKISEKLKMKFIERCRERRTIWSDIFMFLSFDSSICDKSFFYKRPSNLELEEAINYIEPNDQIQDYEPSKFEMNLKDLINYASKPKKQSIAWIRTTLSTLSTMVCYQTV